MIGWLTGFPCGGILYRAWWPALAKPPTAPSMPEQPSVFTALLGGESCCQGQFQAQIVSRKKCWLLIFSTSQAFAMKISAVPWNYIRFFKWTKQIRSLAFSTVNTTKYIVDLALTICNATVITWPQVLQITVLKRVVVSNVFLFNLYNA